MDRYVTAHRLDLDIDEAARHAAEATAVTYTYATGDMELITVACACGEVWRAPWPVGTYVDSPLGQPYLEDWEDHAYAAVEAVPGGAAAIAASVQRAVADLASMYDSLAGYLQWQHQASAELLGGGDPIGQGQWRAQVCRDWIDQYDADMARLDRLDPDNEERQ